ncbi:Na+/H+ antiporter NhaC family protein [Bacillus sp. JJ1503]|uniref:Na+/H+ antiporter NhaC family protein n=1 Tax=Bacillus sp. JJ1503 TaxID=3122956 RepID=UPI002FFDEADC
MESVNHDKKLQFYGGKIGGWIPLGSLVVFMLAFVITDNISLKVFWAAGFFALSLSFLFSKDKKQFSDVSLKGLTDPMFSVLVMIFIFAGILSHLLRQSGLIDGLLWLSTTLGLDAAYLPLITFLACAAISTATGTAGGTVATATPILLPLSVGLGCDPALILGAIISGAFFGDNLAPISDTTIASSLTMESEVPKVVKNRLKYSLIAGFIASILYVIFGKMTTNQLPETLVEDAGGPKTLIMLVIPAIMVFLMIKGKDLVTVLLTCNLVAIILNISMGFMSLEFIINIEGPIVAGISGMLSIIVFQIFLFALLELTKASGNFEEFVKTAGSQCKTPRQAELMVAFLTVMGTVATAINTVAIVMIGPVANKLFKKFNLDRRRGANILDGFSCATAGVLPYNASMMVMFGLAVSSGVLSESFSVMSIPMYSFHAILLFVVFLISIITGWDRRYEKVTGNDIEILKNPINSNTIRKTS